MSGASHTAAENVDILPICGKQYRMSAPPVGQMFAGYESYILEQRTSPFTLARRAVQEVDKDPKMTKEEKQQFKAQIWACATEASTKVGAVSAAEMNEFSQSIRGIAYMLWACLQDYHQEELPTVETVIELLERAVEEEGDDFLDEVRHRVYAVDGTADAKNSSGQPRNGDSEPQPGNEQPNSEAGPKS